MCVMNTDNRRPRPAPWLREERPLCSLEPGALPSRAEAATRPQHRAPARANDAGSRDSRKNDLWTEPPRLNGRRRAPRLHGDGLYSARTPPAGLPCGACCARLSGGGNLDHSGVCGAVWWPRCSWASGPRPNSSGVGRLGGGPSPGACGAGAELAGRTRARAVAPPLSAGKGGRAERLRVTIRLPRPHLVTECLAGPGSATPPPRHS